MIAESLFKPQWFVIQSGEHAGRFHISGWKLSAIETGPDAAQWPAIAICPVCSATVMTSGSYGDMSWTHEQWHARTDFPIPADLHVVNINSHEGKA